MTGSVVVSADAPGTPAEREPVERVQDRSREARLVGRPSPNTGAIATPTPTVAGPSPTPTRTPTPPTAGTRVVEIRSDFFRDRVSLNSITTIDVGTKVQWEWESGFHSTTSGTCCIGDGTWDSLSKSSGGRRESVATGSLSPFPALPASPGEVSFSGACHGPNV
jgi:hypothetical protein